MLTEAIAVFAIRLLEKAGYLGAGALMGLESMIAPVPSEAVMPFVGFLVADGKWQLGPAVLATSLGSLAGSLISYFMGYYGGKPFVLRVGRYLLLNQHDLALTQKFFHRRGGTAALFASRFIPVIRHLISIPAGIGRMPLVPFVLATAVGATLWNCFLILVGMKLRERWRPDLGHLLPRSDARKGGRVTIPLLALLFVLAVLLGSLLGIWALNTLFGLGLAYTVKNWLAMLILELLVSQGGKRK